MYGSTANKQNWLALPVKRRACSDDAEQQEKNTTRSWRRMTNVGFAGGVGGVPLMITVCGPQTAKH